MPARIVRGHDMRFARASSAPADVASFSGFVQILERSIVKIYLCGHGNHHIGQNGFFTLPKDTTVTIYTLPAKLLHQKDVQSIVAGKPGLTPARIVEGLGNCPNLTLSTDSESDKKATESAFKNHPDKDNCKLFFVNDLIKPKSEEDEPSMTLKEIVETSPGNDFVWTCCYNIPLRNTVLGTKYGMNVLQYVRGGDMHVAKTERGIHDFEVNHGDLVVRARAVLKMQGKPSTGKDVTEYVKKLDSPMGLPSRH